MDAGQDLWERVGSCNVAGLTKEKVNFYRRIFETLDIVCLQETHGAEKDIRSRIAKLGFDKGVFSLHTKATRGSAILWRDSVKQIGAPWTDPQGRIAAVNLQKEDSPITLVLSVYAPNVDSSKKSHSEYISFLI